MTINYSYPVVRVSSNSIISETDDTPKCLVIGTTTSIDNAIPYKVYRGILDKTDIYHFFNQNSMLADSWRESVAVAGVGVLPCDLMSVGVLTPAIKKSDQKKEGMERTITATSTKLQVLITGTATQNATIKLSLGKTKTGRAVKNRNNSVATIRIKSGDTNIVVATNIVASIISTYGEQSIVSLNDVESDVATGKVVFESLDLGVDTSKFSFKYQILNQNGVEISAITGLTMAVTTPQIGSGEIVIDWELVKQAIGNEKYDRIILLNSTDKSGFAQFLKDLQYINNIDRQAIGYYLETYDTLSSSVNILTNLSNSPICPIPLKQFKGVVSGGDSSYIGNSLNQPKHIILTGLAYSECLNLQTKGTITSNMRNDLAGSLSSGSNSLASLNRSGVMLTNLDIPHPLSWQGDDIAFLTSSGLSVVSADFYGQNCVIQKLFAPYEEGDPLRFFEVLDCRKYLQTKLFKEIKLKYGGKNWTTASDLFREDQVNKALIKSSITSLIKQEILNGVIDGGDGLTLFNNTINLPNALVYDFVAHSLSIRFKTQFVSTLDEVDINFGIKLGE